MRAFRAIVVIAFCAVVGGACTQKPPVVPPPSDCVTTGPVIRVHGDSLAFHIARNLDAPGRIVVDRSTARSPLSFDLPADPAKGLPEVDAITDQARYWIEKCGVPDVLVIEGGIVDMGGNVGVAQLTAAVQSLSDWLEERHVPTVWMTVHPLPTAGTYMWLQPVRQAYNEWLKGGHVYGTVADCVPYVEDAANPDTLAPVYWWKVDIWGTVDGVHPNDAGYVELARCISDNLPPLD